MTDLSQDDKNNWGKTHILTQFLTLQRSNFTMTQNVLNTLHPIYTNHITIFNIIL